ncbi:hypothetical protein L218DRAFT_990743 [Marasmius fiardii PR-910]|nr:hypothetical protein L218DRAFT_990743 [Marasmius fiardii PR-910]
MDTEQTLLCERCQHNIDIPPLRPIDSLLLHSSHVLSKAESTQTLETLEEETQQLQHYGQIINHLRRSLEKMEAAKQQLEAHIVRRRSIISVQRRIPAEIWDTIFAFTCSFSSAHGYSLTIYGRMTVETQVPIVLSHVCHRWRAIVTGFPWLRSSIKIDLYQPISLGQKTLVETFLAKSEGRPLDLCMRASTVGENCRVTWEMLKRHFSRCDGLDINVRNSDLLNPPRGLQYTFPHLLSFRDHNVYGMGEVHDHPFWKALCQAPKLTKVHLSSLSFRYPVPYTQLATLIIDPIDYKHFAELFKVLEVSKNLRSLSLTINTGRSTSPAHVASRVEMPFLRTLSLDLCDLSPNMDDPTLNALFSSLVMPIMSHFKGELTIARDWNGTPMWSPFLLTMLRNSSSTLRGTTLKL